MGPLHSVYPFGFHEAENPLPPTDRPDFEQDGATSHDPHHLTLFHLHEIPDAELSWEGVLWDRMPLRISIHTYGRTIGRETLGSVEFPNGGMP